MVMNDETEKLFEEGVEIMLENARDIILAIIEAGAKKD